MVNTLVKNIVKTIADNTDKLRDAIDDLQFLVGTNKMAGKETTIDGEKIDIETLEKFQSYLEEIRKFALYV